MTDEWYTAERLAAFVPDDRSNNDPGVYALVVDLPEYPEAIAHQWEQHYDSYPDYFDRLVEADRGIYVGATGSDQRPPSGQGSDGQLAECVRRGRYLRRVVSRLGRGRV